MMKADKAVLDGSSVGLSKRGHRPDVASRLLVAAYLACALAAVVWLATGSHGNGAVGVGPPRAAVGDSDGSGEVTVSEGGPGPAGLVIVGLHPRCPCSSATLELLGRMLSDARGGQGRVRPQLMVWVFVPARAGELDRGWTADVGRVLEWTRTLGQGVRVELDVGGGRMRRLGLTASGHVLVYASDGSLVASGGLTATRGHREPSGVARALSTWLRAGEVPAAVPVAPVFGCTW